MWWSPGSMEEDLALWCSVMCRDCARNNGDGKHCDDYPTAIHIDFPGLWPGYRRVTRRTVGSCLVRNDSYEGTNAAQSSVVKVHPVDLDIHHVPFD